MKRRVRHKTGGRLCLESLEARHLLTAMDVGDDYTDSFSDEACVAEFQSTISGRNESTTDRDVFRFEAQAGEVYSFGFNWNLSGRDFRTTLAVFDQTGQELFNAARTDEPLINWKAPQTGRFYFAVQNESRSSRYELTFDKDDHPNIASRAESLPVNVVHRGGLYSREDVDWLRFSTQPGSTYVVTAATSDAKNIDVEVRDADRNILAQDLNGYAGRATVTAEGDSILVAISTQDVFATGDYEVSVLEFDPVTLDLVEEVGDGELEFGAPDRSAPILRDGEISQLDEVDTYRFRAVQGSHVYVVDTQLGSLSNSWIGIRASGSDTYIASSADDGDSLASRLVWTAPNPGVYEVDVRGQADVGTYGISLAVLPDDHPDAISLGGTLVETDRAEGILGYDGDVDVLRVEVNAEDIYWFSVDAELESSPVEVTLHSEDGSLVSRLGSSPYLWQATEQSALFIRVQNEGVVNRPFAINAEKQTDDYPQTLDDATEVSPGTISGRLESSADEDVFAVSLPAGTIAQLVGSTSSVWTVELLDESFGTAAVAGDRSWVSDGTQRFLRVSPNGAQFGDYEFELAIIDDDHGDLSSPSRVTIGEWTSQFEVLADSDAFVFSATAGQSYRLDGQFTVFSVVDPNGEEITVAGATNRLRWKAAVDGDYLLFANNVNRTGDYTLTLSELEDDYPDDVSPENQLLESGVTIEGSVEASGDVDVFVFDALEDANVEFTFNAPFSLRYTVASLDGETVYFSDSSRYGQWVAPADGRYAVLVESEKPSYGDYTLKAVTIDDFPDASSAAGVLVLQDQQTQAGNLETTNDVDVFAFDAEAGADIQIDAEINSRRIFDLRLRDSSGTELTTSRGRLLRKVEEAGRYFIDVFRLSSGGAGPYELTLYSTDDHPDSPLEDQSPIGFGTTDARLNTLGDIDVLAFDATQGQVIRVELASDDLRGNTAMRIITPKQEDQVVADSAADFTWKVQETGRHYLELSSPVDLFGDYSVTLSTIEGGDDHVDVPLPTAIELEEDVLAPGRHEVWYDADIFVLNAVANESFRINASRITLPETATLRILDALGNELKQSGTAEIVWQAEVAGTYFLETSSGQNVGSYEIRMSSLIDDYPDRIEDAGPLPLEGSVSGVLEISGDLDIWSFEVQEQEVITFDTGNNGFPYETIQILNGDGTVLSESSRLLPWRAGTPGTYFLAVTDPNSRREEELGYSFVVSSTFDDHFDIEEKATPIELGQTVNGVSELSGDVDMFVFSAQAGDILRVTSDAGSGVQRTYGRNGWIDATSWKVAEDGMQFVRHAQRVESYEFLIERIPDDHPDIANDDVSVLLVDTPTPVRFEHLSDRDFLAVDTQVGQSYRVELSTGGDIRVLSSTGESLGFCFTCNEWSWKARETGRQFLQLEPRSAFQVDQHEVKLSLLDVQDDYSDFPDANASLLTRGERVEGAIDIQNEFDVFAFDAVEGEILDFTVDTSSGSLRTLIYDAEGTVLEELERTSAWPWKALKTGRYYVGVSMQGEAGYTLAHALRETDDHFDRITDSAATLELGVLVSGLFELPNDVDFFRVDANSNEAMRLIIKRDGIGTAQARLFDANGDLITAASLASELTWTTANAGRYYVSIESTSAGMEGYTAILSSSSDDHADFPSESSLPLDVGSEVSASLEVGGDVDVFAFTAEMGTEYTVSVNRDSLASNSTIEILSAEGESLASKFGSKLSWTAPSSGRHYISLRGTRAVGYTLGLTSSAPVTGDLNGDQRFNGEDVDHLFAAIRDGSSNLLYDINEDGVVDLTDMDAYQARQNIIPGDANLDGQVSFADFLQLSIGFGSSGGWSDGDFDGDEQVTFADFLLLSEQFGRQQ